MSDKNIPVSEAALHNTLDLIGKLLTLLGSLDLTPDQKNALQILSQHNNITTELLNSYMNKSYGDKDSSR